MEINSRCISCDNCRLICPESSILTDGLNYNIETWSCTMCQYCVQVCPTTAIVLNESALKETS
ncbi:MAG: 4Fe-4S dicluster domain-containing protein [Bacteriovoracaceae bacterium]|nr:4Fe-4S dicluster domain-containing protein [Bacteriovoracaceae bacterium]